MSNKLNIWTPNYIPKGTDASVTIVGPWTYIEGIDNLLWVVAWAGGSSLVTTPKVEICNDQRPKDDGSNYIIGPADYTTYTKKTVAATSGSSGSMIVEINQTGARYIRLSMVSSSGTGTLGSNLEGKSV